MAATTINVQAVRDSLRKSQNELTQQQSSLDKIDKIINSMSGIWESEDQRVYAEQFQSTKRKIESFNSYINESLTNIDNFVSDCVAVDDQTGRELRNVQW